MEGASARTFLTTKMPAVRQATAAAISGSMYLPRNPTFSSLLRTSSGFPKGNPAGNGNQNQNEIATKKRGDLENRRGPEKLPGIEFRFGNLRSELEERFGAPQRPQQWHEQKERRRPNWHNCASDGRARLHFLSAQPELGGAVLAIWSGLRISGKFGMQRQQKHE